MVRPHKFYVSFNGFPATLKSQNEGSPRKSILFVLWISLSHTRTTSTVFVV
jgi:hypothetical protein